MRSGEGSQWEDRAPRSGVELHICSLEQVVSGESLSPELRRQLRALLLQRPQHHIQTTGIRPCRGERSLFGPPDQDSGMGGSQESSTFS